MKFKKAVCSVLILMFAFMPIFTIFSYADGAKPISSYEDFLNISKDLKGEYYLTCDIVADGKKSYSPQGSETQLFDGVLDGKGYSITGLNIEPIKSESGNSYYSGLFLYNRGTIKNLNIVDATVNAKNSKYTYFGIISGINLGNIENCYVSGAVYNTGVTIAGYTGAFCGQMLRGKIKNSVSYANVYSKGGEQMTGGIVGSIQKGDIDNTAVFSSVFANGTDAERNTYIGGIAGETGSNSKINNCLFAGGLLGEKSSDIYIGGISGKTKGEITKSISYGSVTPSEITSYTYIGGITGDDYSATIKDAYYLDGTFNEKATEYLAKKVNSKDFLNTASFPNIDFGGIWGMGNVGPILKGLPTIPTNDAISALNGITITKKPKKLNYIQGDQTLDLTGLEVEANYSGGSQKLSKNEYTVGGYNYATVGKQVITVSYKGFTDTFTITVEKTDEPIISIGTLTEGSYQDGTANGVLKEEESTPSKNTNSTQKENDSASSKPQYIANAVEDNMEEDDITPSKDTASTNAQKTKGASTILIILIVISALVLASVITILFFRFKPAHSEEEINEAMLKEEDYDDADVYK